MLRYVGNGNDWHTGSTPDTEFCIADKYNLQQTIFRRPQKTDTKHGTGGTGGEETETR